MKDLRIIFFIAKNTFKEISRNRIFYICMGLSFLFLTLSVTLGHLSFAEKARITMNLGLSIIHIVMVFVSILLGSTLISKEVEKRTILTLLAHPLDRWHFLFGKALGLIFMMTLFVGGLSFALFLVLYGVIKDGINIYLWIVYGILLESFLLIVMTLFWSSFTRPFLVVSFSILFFAIGHWLHTLHFFLEKSESVLFKFFGQIFLFALPDLEKFNWRSFLVYKNNLSLETLFSSSLYAFFWISFFLFFSLLIIRKRSFD